MPYATLASLVARYGEAEMTRLTTPEGVPMAGVVAARAEAELARAAGLIDSYLRRRYDLPLPAPVPPELEAACCALARYELSFGSQVAPSEQARLARKDVVSWLEALADGRAVLAGATPIGATPAAVSGAMASDREREFAHAAPPRRSIWEMDW